MPGHVHFKLQLVSIPEPTRGFSAIYQKLRQQYLWFQLLKESCSKMVYEPPTRKRPLGQWWQTAFSPEEQPRSIEQAIQTYKWVSFAGDISIGGVGVFCDVECLPQKQHTGAVEIFLNSVAKSDEMIDYFRLSAKERRKRGSLPKKRTGLERFCLDLAQAADARGFALFYLDDAPSPMVSYITLFKKIRGAEALRPYYDELARRVEQEPALQDELDEVLEELTTPYREFIAPDDERGDSFHAVVFGIKAPYLPSDTRRYEYYPVSRGYEMGSYLPD